MVLPGVLEQRPGAGGEILQPRADGEHHVGLLGQPRWRPTVPVTPTAPMLSGWSSGSDDLPACVSHDRNAVRLGEARQARPRRRE